MKNDCTRGASLCMAARHHSDLVFCRKLPGITVGKLCEKCDGRCPICDSNVRPTTQVRICDECNYGTNQDKCIVCSGMGTCDAYYCKECTILEKDVTILVRLFNVPFMLQ